MGHIFENRDPTKALARVTLADMTRPGSERQWMPGLLNPQSLSYNISVAIGELNPVGASSSVLQYGYTKSPTVPLEFYFSSQLGPRRGGTPVIRQYVDWLGAFCFPTAKGAAPPPLSVIWPKTANFSLAVETFNAEYVRFHSQDLAPMAVRVSITAKELRFAFHSFLDHKNRGFRDADPLVRQLARTGGGLNLKGR